MPISRVMNMPDGSTPPVPVGGGDVNGTLNTALMSHAGTGAIALDVPRHLKFTGSTSLGIPGATAPQTGEGMGQATAVEEGAFTMTGIEAAGQPAAEPEEPGEPDESLPVPSEPDPTEPPEPTEPAPAARSARRR